MVKGLRESHPEELFPGTTDTAMEERERLGEVPQLSRVAQIYETSLRYQTLQEHEAGWNCFVHAPLLALAHELSRYGTGLDTANM